MRTALAAASIQLDPALARRKVAEYVRAVRERHEQEDIAILRGYRALAKGHTVIDLPHVISLGGVHDNGLPKLAIATASHDFVHVQRDHDGRVDFQLEQWPAARRRKDIYRCGAGTLPVTDGPRVWQEKWGGGMRAMVPHIPPALRPIHSLANYQVLFEVDRWQRAPRPPGDPALLKHIGGDLYAVLATWDLTELEQSVLMGRIR